MTLPDLNSTKDISGEQVKEFQNKGHILIKNILNGDEVNAYRPVIVDAAEKYATEKRDLEDRDTYGKAFLQIMNLWRADNRVKKFVLAKRFAHIAATLLEVENVRLYHDQALFKESGGGPTPWHIDQFYWPLDTTNTITMWMPLVDISESMGMLSFASGSHQHDHNFEHEISEESNKEIKEYLDKYDFPISRAKTMKAGDATWHFGNIVHGAPGNESDSMREVITIIYYADGAKVTKPDNEFQENDRNQWLGGLSPGEKAASELNPVLL